MKRIVLRIAAVIVVVLACICVVGPATALANLMDLRTSASCTFSVTYPHDDQDEDGDNDYVLETGALAAPFKYTYLEPVSEDMKSDGTMIAQFIVEQGKDYFYRVSNPESNDAVTFGDYLTVSSDDNANSVTVTRADMRTEGDDAAFDSSTVVNDFSRSPYDTGDIYLNVGPAGHVRLSVGEDFSLYPMRNWLPISNDLGAHPLEPDFHVEVVDLDGAGAVTAREHLDDDAGKHKWVLTANHAGTALVKVTYDALVHGSAKGGSDFGAIWPENTGLFVVTVGQPSDVDANCLLNVERNAALQAKYAESSGYYGASAKVAGDVLDAEFDTLYYLGDDGASYTFSPEQGSQVTVARGSVVDGAIQLGAFTEDGVSFAADGSVTVSGLVTGKHILCVEKGGNVAYQVIRARKVQCKVYAGAYKPNKAGVYTFDEGKLIFDSADGVVYAYTDGVSPLTREAYEAFPSSMGSSFEPLVSPGGTVTFAFSGLQHPANKVQGCYNMSAFVSLEGDDGVLFEPEISAVGESQYKFASSAASQILKAVLPNELAEGCYGLSGALLESGFGYDGYGSHRSVTYENSYAPRPSIAPTYRAYFGQLPKLVLDVVAAGGDTGPTEDEIAQQAADDFAALVNAIGTVDLNAAGRISAARSAYEALSDAARARVSAAALALLGEAEAQLVELQRSHFMPADIAEGCVRVVVENSTWSCAEGAPWEGVLFDRQVQVDLLTDTARTLVDKAIEEEGYSSKGDPDYLSAIGGLGDPGSRESCYGDAAGWMVMFNGWFINQGMNAFEARLGAICEGDEIHLVYTCDGGPDVKSYQALDVKTLDTIIVNTGMLSPAFDSTVHDYELVVPTGTSQVYVKPLAANRNFQARVYLGTADAHETGYRFNDAIHVQEGSVISILVGDKSWPSMTSSSKQPEMYTLTIRFQKDDPVDPAGPDSSDEKIVAKTTVTLNAVKVTKASVKKACKKAGLKQGSIKKVVLGKRVKRIAPRAFSACGKAKTLVLKTKKLTKKSVKQSLAKSKIKTVYVKVGSSKINKKYAKKYRKLFTRPLCGKRVNVKAFVK